MNPNFFVLFLSFSIGANPFSAYADNGVKPAHDSHTTVASELSTSIETINSTEKPKNIILLIGDGMGPSAIKALRKFKAEQGYSANRRLSFDDYLLGSINTDSIDDSENITDSAAAATAFATGRKTINGAVSVDSHSQPFTSVLELAKRRGMSTGMVVTSSVTHATPAAFASHHIDRDEEADIADQYFDVQWNQKPHIDVLLGGGRKYFARKDRNLIAEFKTKGYQVVVTREQLLNSKNEKLLGLFARDGLDMSWDRTGDTPSLAEMTKVALAALSSNEKGFFLLIEGSQIDWAAHANDIVGVISEMQDFESAFKVTVEFAEKNSDTLVLATADHGTGGLSIGADSSGEDLYFWDSSVISAFTETPKKIAKDAKKSGDLLAELRQASSLVFSSKEKQMLANADLNDWEATRKLIAKIVAKHSHTGWTTFGHTGEDVNLYGLGPSSEMLRGYHDNTYIGLYLLQIMRQ